VRRFSNCRTGVTGFAKFSSIKLNADVVNKTLYSGNHVYKQTHQNPNTGSSTYVCLSPIRLDSIFEESPEFFNESFTSAIPIVSTPEFFVIIYYTKCFRAL
jgi:hypothetical protein